jgi:hypothetical protein
MKRGRRPSPGSSLLPCGPVDDGFANNLKQRDEVFSMLNRIVSMCSVFMVILSVVFFGLGAWWTLVGRISEGDGVFMMVGWCVSAMVFSYRAIDPAYLDAVSIIKSH